MSYYSLGCEVHSTETYSKIAEAVNEKTAKMLVDVLNAAQQSVRADVAPQWRCKCGWANFENVKLCSACGTQRR